MNIAVIGATGALGRHVVPRLVERGHHVRAIVRQPSQVERLSQMGVKAVLGDILIPKTLVPATGKCDAALHLATSIPKTENARDWRMNDLIRREGTHNFLAACLANDVRRYVQQSITFLYGDSGTHIANEEAPLKPTAITRSALDMENLVRATGLEWCILRGGLFYGKHTGREEKWRQAAQAGTLQIPGDGTAFLSLVHVVDMARAVIMAVERAEAGSIYNVVDDEPVECRTLYHYIAAQENGPPPQAGGDAVLPSGGCSNARIKTELGWEPVYATFRAGLV